MWRCDATKRQHVYSYIRVAAPCHLLPRSRDMGLLLISATRLTPWVMIPRRRLATVAAVAERRKVSQTVIEKIVQKYAVGLPPGKQVKAGDYVMIRPEHVMTHDNTGPVISKFVAETPISCNRRILMWGF